MAGKYKNAFKFTSSGEIDMIVADELGGKCEIYEIKHSDKAV